MPEAFYLAGAARRPAAVRRWCSPLALVLSLVLAAALASMVTAPLRRMARATQAMARGDLSARVPGSRLEELGALAQSFNDMAGQAQDVVRRSGRRSRDAEEPRARAEQSERRLRVSDDRLQLAIDRGRARHLRLLARDVAPVAATTRLAEPRAAG